MASTILKWTKVLYWLMGIIPHSKTNEIKVYVDKSGKTLPPKTIELGPSMMFRLFVISGYVFTTLVLVINGIVYTQKISRYDLLFSLWISTTPTSVCLLLVCFQRQKSTLDSLYRNLEKLVKSIGKHHNSFVTTEEILTALLLLVAFSLRCVIVGFFVHEGHFYPWFEDLSLAILSQIASIVTACEYYHTKIISNCLNIRCQQILESWTTEFRSRGRLHHSKYEGNMMNMNVGDDNHNPQAVDGNFSKEDLNNDDQVLLQIEETFLETDRVLGDLLKVYGYPNLYLSINFLANIIFTFYFGASNVLNKIFTVERGSLTYIYLVINSLVMIFVLHDPADKFQESQAKCVAMLEGFLHSPQQRASPTLALRVMGLVRKSRHFTMANFGGMGRGSATNTLAFILSYVVIAIQFNMTLTDPARKIIT